MKISESISISTSPEKIWGFWLPVSTDAQWRNGIARAEWTSQPPHGIGSTGVHYAQGLGAFSWEVTNWEDGRYFEFIHTKGRLKGSIASYHVEPENEGSRASLHANFSGPFIMRVIMVLMKGKLRKGMKGDLQKLKDLMEKPE
ncbi:MAG: SRPBCC family protein [Bacteroidota bacterium]